MDDHLARNRREWNRWAPDWVERGRRSWSQAEITWGSLEVVESDLGLLGDVAGKRVLELGCGTAYFSSWLARRGATVLGLDLSEHQLESALLLQREFKVSFPLIQANAEQVPIIDGTFDLVLSEYGASIWADPYRWVPEAFRMLRPGGELVFLVGGTFRYLCDTDEELATVGDRLLRPYFGMHRAEWKGDDSVDFHLPYGEWIRLLRSTGFEVEGLVELQAPPHLTPDPRYGFTPDWARQWPAEEIWKARKRASSPASI